MVPSNFRVGLPGHNLPLFLQLPNSSNVNALTCRFSRKNITKLYADTEAHKAALEIPTLKAGQQL